jgi:hypothetical protein
MISSQTSSGTGSLLGSATLAQPCARQTASLAVYARGGAEVLKEIQILRCTAVTCLMYAVEASRWGSNPYAAVTQTLLKADLYDCEM